MELYTYLQSTKYKVFDLNGEILKLLRYNMYSYNIINSLFCNLRLNQYIILYKLVINLIFLLLPITLHRPLLIQYYIIIFNGVFSF